MRRVVALVLLLLSLRVAAKTVNPLDYGLKMAKSGEERYYALKRCHEDAANRGFDISYNGIDRIELTIPKDATTLPLTRLTDFAGVRLVVENRQNDFMLFKMQGKAELINIDGHTIDSGELKQYDQLRQGTKLLLIQDENPWINTRLGYNSSTVYKRKDILVLKNGKAQNKTIMPYGNKYSDPKVWYVNTNGKKSVVKNLVFERTPSSTFITKVLAFRFIYRLSVESISVVTPQGVITQGDGCFLFEDCADIEMKDITIEGTYSSPNLTGYGIRMLNVFDVKIQGMNAHGDWGIFGNYNVNQVQLKNCDINRFDVHYYGKDIKSDHCTYRDLYNQFASVYGDVLFRNCEFIDHTPVLIESSFNAYTPFNLSFINCRFHFSKKHNYLITLFGVKAPYNDRPELHRKSLPNVTLKNCKVYLDDDVDKWQVFKTHGVAYRDSFDYITDVSINNVCVFSKVKKPFEMFSEEMKTTKPITVKMKRFNY